MCAAEPHPAAAAPPPSPQVEGIRGFCPGSQLGFRVATFEELLGREMQFKITEVRAGGGGGGSCMRTQWLKCACAL